MIPRPDAYHLCKALPIKTDNVWSFCVCQYFFDVIGPNYGTIEWEKAKESVKKNCPKGYTFEQIEAKSHLLVMNALKKRAETPKSNLGICPVCGKTRTENDVDKMYRLLGKVDFSTPCYRCALKKEGS
jgi:hypothetical protein